MKSLQESLFSNDLISKDLFNDPTFKKWINRPDILWYIYYYWEDEMEDMLDDFFHDEWKKYKPTVDLILKLINDKCDSLGVVWGYSCSLDQYDMFPEQHDMFNNEEEFEELLGDAIHEVQHKSTQEHDGIWKTWFRGAFPKNSAVKAFIDTDYSNFIKPGKTDGGIFLTNQDGLIILAFPKGIDKSILKLFDIIK